MLYGAPDGPLPVGEKDERATGVKGEPVSPELALVREDVSQRRFAPRGRPGGLGWNPKRLQGSALLLPQIS